MAVSLLLVQLARRLRWPIFARGAIVALSILACLALPAAPGLAPALSLLLQGVLALAMLRCLAPTIPSITLADAAMMPPQPVQTPPLLLSAPGTDALTGLPDNTSFEACIAAWSERAADERTSLGLILLEIDHFAGYRDYYGHHAADACLQSVALTLREQLRTTGDFIARLQSETFAIILPGVSVSHCSDVAERLRAAIAACELPNLGDDNQDMISVSAGVASQVPHDTTSLIAAAQMALHTAKTSGRNQVLIAVPQAVRMAELAIK